MDLERATDLCSLWPGLLPRSILVHVFLTGDSDPLPDSEEWRGRPFLPLLGEEGGHINILSLRFDDAEINDNLTPLLCFAVLHLSSLNHPHSLTLKHVFPSSVWSR